jgi:hypothetical protein
MFRAFRLVSRLEEEAFLFKPEKSMIGPFETTGGEKSKDADAPAKPAIFPFKAPRGMD